MGAAVIEAERRAGEHIFPRAPGPEALLEDVPPLRSHRLVGQRDDAPGVWKEPDQLLDAPGVTVQRGR